jgi:hypothetical protein
LNRLYFPAEMLLILVPNYGLRSGNLGVCYGAGIGYSGGVGYHINRYMSAELNYRSIGMKYCENLAMGSNPPKDDYGTITSNELVLNLGVFL